MRPRAAPTPKPSMSLRALIVEDNAVARQFLARVVRDSFSDDIVFSEAGDLDAARNILGIQAGERVQLPHDAFRLILCDIEQPDGSGLELLAQLCDYPAIKIATTLHSDDDHLFPALQCGANGYLLKEDRFEVLVEELQRIVRGQPPLSPAMARRLLGFFRASDTSTRVGLVSQFPRTDGFAVSGLGASMLPGRHSDLITERESEVLQLLSKGFTIKEIGRSMGLKWFEVNDHIRSVYRKLALTSSPGDALRQSRQAFNP
jgi:two-component system, NarL family, nitrate/nitrite response regulator NarL